MTSEETISVAIVNQQLGPYLPVEWTPIDGPFPGMIALRNRKEQLTAILTASPQLDNRIWLHLSLSGRHSLPSWDQLVRTKEALLGPDLKAIQVLAPRSQWVNIHPNCLHLWICLDEDPLPDFTQGFGSI